MSSHSLDYLQQQIREPLPPYTAMSFRTNEILKGLNLLFWPNFIDNNEWGKVLGFIDYMVHRELVARWILERSKPSARPNKVFPVPRRLA